MVYTQGAHLECAAQMSGEAVPLDTTEHLLHKATLPSLGHMAALLVHRNKHRDAAKMRRQRNMFQIKKKKKTTEK